MVATSRSHAIGRRIIRDSSSPSRSHEDCDLYHGLLELRAGEVLWSGRVVVPVERVIDRIGRRNVLKIERRRFNAQPVLWGAVAGVVGGIATCAATLKSEPGDLLTGRGALFCGALGGGIGAVAGSIAGGHEKFEVVYDVNDLP